MDDLDFLSGGGEMGARIRAYDWNATSLGAPAQWPQGLKTSVRWMLSSGHPMLIWWGPDLVQLYNDAYRRLLGPERHPSALGARGRDCWAEAWEIMGPEIEHVLAGKGHTWKEDQLIPITRHGKRQEAYWTYGFGPIGEPAAPNGVGGVLALWTETTGHVLAERRLTSADERWRALFDQTPGFVAILQGPEHVFEFANPRYFDLVGQRDIIGRPIREALPEMAEQGVVHRLDEVYRTGDPYVGEATPMLLTHGPREAERRRYLDFVYQPIRDASGAVTGIFVSGSDVTERVVASRSLRDEDRRKDEFLAMLGHELRNPLSAIQNASELLTRNPASDRTARMVGELLARQVTQLGRLVDDLLDVSRITQGRIELKRQRLELGSAVLVALETVQPLMLEKRHRVINVPSTEPLYVEGDPARIVQSISNVLTNAAKYTEAAGRIQITLKKQGTMAVIEVADNGVGIPQELLPKVFELFVQGERASDRSQGGLGIGLSVVRRLVEMHGGDVSVTSAGRGRGSTFQIRLPLAPEANLPITWSAKPAAQHPHAHCQRVLVVDDNADAADSLAELLRIVGHEAATAYGAREALDLARQFAADVVLLDIGLPEMNGYEVARRMRERGEPPVLVALTGYGQTSDVQRAKDAGFDAHITKPIALEQLQRILETF